MPLALLVPGLLDVATDALASAPALRRIAARATPQAAEDADDALLRALGLPATAAPFAALGAGLAVGGDWVARADPVSVELTREDVRIIARVDDLAHDEAGTLLALLARHFADDGLAFAAPRPDAWFVHSSRPYAVALPSLTAALRGPLRTQLPHGDDAKPWRRWWTEVQMLLHEHPLALRTPAPVHALWFSAPGTLPSSLPPLQAFATATRHGDVVRGLAATAHRHAKPPPALADTLATARRGTTIAAACDPVVDAAGLAALEPILDAALAAVDAGRLDRVVLVAGGRERAATWQVDRAGWLARMWPRSAPFVAPSTDLP